MRKNAKVKKTDSVKQIIWMVWNFDDRFFLKLQNDIFATWTNNNHDQKDDFKFTFHHLFEVAFMTSPDFLNNKHQPTIHTLNLDFFLTFNFVGK